MARRFRYFFPLGIARPVTVVFLTIWAGCRDSKHSSTPADLASEPALPALAVIPSRFDVPLQYDFTPVLRIIEQAVPTTFGSLDSIRVVGIDSSKRYAYTATRGPFVATAEGQTVRMRATLSYAARGYYKPPIGPTLSAGCGSDDARPRITVELSAPITLSSNWHLQSKASLTRLEPASDSARDRCEVSIIKYDVTNRVIEAARAALTKQLPGIDRKVARVDLTRLATGWWQTLNRPIRLADSVWLVLQPRQLRLGSVTGQGHELIVRAGLDALPQIVTGVMPKDSAPPLPPLARDDSVSSGFQVSLDGLVDYDAATRGVTAGLVGKRFTKGGRTVVVHRTDVAPLGAGKLLLTMQFEGDTDGRLRFIGTPRYDARRKIMTVPDLEFDLDTDDRLVGAYAWLRSDAVRDQLRSMATISIQPALDRGEALLLKGLNRKLGDAVTLSASVDSVAVRGVYVTRAGLLVRAAAFGDAGMKVKQRRRS
jgi:hypothetical protein